MASGVVMEGLSVEDQGDGISFHVYIYNVQPGVEIDYATGDNWEADTAVTSSYSENVSLEEADYVLNTSSHKFHRPDCSAVETMSEKNKEEYHGTREELIEEGYDPCGICNP